MQITPLTHHLNQANYWLEQSATGTHSTCIAYAALETRYAVERLAVHYWSQLETGHPAKFQLEQVGSFKSLEKRIYELAGHQKEIDLTFKYFSILLGCLGIEVSLNPPKISLLSSIWHMCSEICHIGWVLACGQDQKLSEKAFIQLQSACNSLQAMATTSSSIPLFDGAAAIDMRNSFVRGVISEEDVRAWVKEQGLYAVHKPPSGKAEFVGKAVPPGGA